ncbi:hypothetical protein EVAR_28709_1 [Eumeta japonica]|uniref:Uncharacterized protein n=1 Tax=Eumeta variegata TaxID=151549 RepID=A0A4C1V6B0_EUMVA|nr:hypothetical protein EVAR_28709_1 [Eumeta japonica]
MHAQFAWRVQQRHMLHATPTRVRGGTPRLAVGTGRWRVSAVCGFIREYNGRRVYLSLRAYNEPCTSVFLCGTRAATARSALCARAGSRRPLTRLSVITFKGSPVFGRRAGARGVIGVGAVRASAGSGR